MPATADLFVFDDQLHLVRGSRPSPADLPGRRPGASSAPGSVEPLQTFADELGGDQHPVEPCAGRVADRPRLRPHHAVHQGRVPGQPGHHRAPEQRERLDGPRSGHAPAAAEHQRRPSAASSSRPPRPPPARNFVNDDLRLDADALPRPALRRQGQPGSSSTRQIDKHEPDSWKGYNISNSAKVDDDPNSLMRQWRHDDEQVAYPMFELIQQNYDRLKGK